MENEILNATIVYQMTEEQLMDFAHRVVEETRDSVAEELHKRVAAAVGNRFDYCSFTEAMRITNRTRQTLHKWIKTGRVTIVKNGKNVLFLRSDLAREAAAREK